jgi:[acyl-carrier-protein] S-malonyltransferase
MGAALLEARPEVFDQYTELAEDAAGLPIRQIMLEGPQEELTRTDVAQPALFALSLALLELAREQGLEAECVAGHSLGEYTAAAAAESLSPQDGMRLVARRGALMAEVQSERPGSMAAIIGLGPEAVEQLCQAAAQGGTLAPANINSPEQIVVSGEEAAIERVLTLAREAGAKQAVRLEVGAAFHSEMMEPVQRELSRSVEAIAWSDPTVPLASNASGELLTTASEVREALIAQIASPVRWLDCVTALRRHGCQTFLELGPGRVLGRLVRQIDPSAHVFAADSPAKLEAFGEAMVTGAQGGESAR